MARMTKYSYITIGVIIVSLLIGGFIYSQQEDGASQKQPATQDECKTIEEKEVCAKDYVGLSETEAVSKAEEKEIASRVIERDGKGLLVNSDRNENRLNFTVENGIVTKVEFF